MPGCTFNVSGEYFDVDGFLSIVEWEVNYVFHKGEVSKKPEFIWEDSGFGMTVSDSDGFLHEELEDVVRFLDENFSTIEKLKTKFKADELSFDFGYYCRLYNSEGNSDCFSHGESIKPSILKKCGDLGIRIDLSIYHWPSEEPKRKNEA